MYFCVFWCEIIDLVGFFGWYCLGPKFKWNSDFREQTPIFDKINTRTFKSNSDVPLKLILCKSGPKEAFFKTLKRAPLNPKQPQENKKGKL